MINHVNKDVQEPQRQKRKKELRLGRLPSLLLEEAHETEAAVKVTAQNLGINQEGLRPRAHAGEQEVTVKSYL